MNRNAAIGVFDSGMGGLTVMRALCRALPRERFIYLGDTARLPYGTKSADTVKRYALQAAFAPLPVMGVIAPGADAAIAATPAGPIAVIATEGTVKGGAYVRAIEARGRVGVVQQACPLFVPMSEEGLIAGPIAEAIAHRYLDPLLAMVPQPKCLLLACTHYPVLKDVIAKVTGDSIVLVDSAATAARAAIKLLAENDLSAERGENGPPQFLVTDAPDRFARVGEIFFGQTIDPGCVSLVDLQ